MSYRVNPPFQRPTTSGRPSVSIFTKVMESTTTIDGLTFTYCIDGPLTAPTILLSNPLTATYQIWDPIIPALTTKYRVLRYDHRGHGKTDVPKTPCTFERLADDVAALLDALKIPRLASFIGDSMGAATAILFANRHPGRTESYVLIDTISNSSPPETDVFGPRADVARTEGMTNLAEGTLGRWFSPQFTAAHPETIEKVRRMILGTPVEGFVASIRALQDFDLKPYFGDVGRDAPKTLVMVGELDKLLVPTMKVMAEEIGKEGKGDVKYVVIPNAGHVPFVDGTDKVVEELKTFLGF